MHDLALFSGTAATQVMWGLSLIGFQDEECYVTQCNLIHHYRRFGEEVVPQSSAHKSVPDHMTSHSRGY
jgi:hypothetical protein